MSGYNLVKMQNKLKKYMDEPRFLHTQGVMYTAGALAMCHETDVERAMVAGLLHDSAKCIPNSKKLRLCEKYGVPVSDCEQKTPHLLHAKLGAVIAREKYDICDEEILSAIACHTTGKAAMSLLEKILFVADYIEPGRTKAPNLVRIRTLAFTDLDLSVYLTLRDTLYYLKQSKSELDHQSLVAYNYYKDLVKQEENE